MSDHEVWASAPGSSRHERINRARWNEFSDEYQREHNQQLRSGEIAWGTWSIPESDLHALDDVLDKDVLELGCGAAQWSIKLGRAGAHPVGIDIADAQLRHAVESLRQTPVRVPLVQASAEALPFAPHSFDIVFCDHGAMNFTDPRVTVREVARVLRPGGLFAFNMPTPIFRIAWEKGDPGYTREFRNDYFDVEPWEEEMIDFQLPYGEWIRLFRRNGFVVEDLIEIRPPDGATTSHDFVALEWAQRWPAEHIWKVRRLP